MGYIFTNRGFAWTKTGVDATASEIELGLQGGMALPAAFVNQQWSKTYAAIKEIQDAIEQGLIGVDTVNGIFAESLKVGGNHTVNGTHNNVLGEKNVASGYNTVVGKASKTPTATEPNLSTGDVFIVGNGLSGGARSNALRVTAAGDVMGVKAYAATGADYAECFEWADGNASNEDRRGLFVTLDGEKIRLANADDDYIVGIVSATPSIIGDACSDDWQGKYVTDIFGSRVLENGAYKLSEGFDKSMDDNYTSRLERPEWAVVGLVGKLIVVDDGSCQVNGYCYPNKNGIATASDKGYRVMARLDKSHVKVLIK